MIFFALKLLLAHLMGDFLFQPDSWVAKKRKNKQRSPQLYFHIGVHALAMIVLLKFELKYWFGIMIILITHYLIDLAKLHFESISSRGRFFFFDQLAHLLVIAIVVYNYYPFALELSGIYNPVILLFIISLILIGPVAAILMRLMMSRWELPEDKENDSLPQAGKYIGMLERILVFGFILLQQWPAIGWLIAAKSILRFSDLSRAKDRKLTEYVLIGTLLSFSMAVIAGILFQYLRKIF